MPRLDTQPCTRSKAVLRVRSAPWISSYPQARLNYVRLANLSRVPATLTIPLTSIQSTFEINPWASGRPPTDPPNRIRARSL
ncbi:hypothetical protein PsYK624_047080 [Phanerochaete sordida]|uniref:Uncharacterized protein n=1 Tax=Phanerochaete sordida TaxID=48140 RepID=A0A9P3G6B6_9APHY|nr:hypothetical protein PsYK624_047080 [Phanerochaete sordida]